MPAKGASHTNSMHMLGVDLQSSICKFDKASWLVRATSRVFVHIDLDTWR